MSDTPQNSPSSAPLPVADFEFDLPAELIAQEPSGARDESRLMLVGRGRSGVGHQRVADLPSQLRPGDLLIVNDTRVIPARVRGQIGNGKAELLLLHRLASVGGSAGLSPNPPAPFPEREGGVPGGSPSDRIPPSFQGKGDRGLGERWLCMGKPGKRLVPGARIRLQGGRVAEVVAQRDDGRVEVEFDGDEPVLAYLDRHGELPLPPYIRRPEGPSEEDRKRYQTIFASAPGAVAAPTAGLHFTPQLLAAIEARGVQVARLTLHVGPGTFLPVRCDDFRDHRLDAEWYEIPSTTEQAMHDARARGGRVIAIGTTTTRALESAAREGELRAGSGWADIYIVPGHEFRAIDGLFTNFHLPGSTLLLLVSAFAGTDIIRAAYAEAIRERYRFYSYGDAMLIL